MGCIHPLTLSLLLCADLDLKLIPARQDVAACGISAHPAQFSCICCMRYLMDVLPLTLSSVMKLFTVENYSKEEKGYSKGRTNKLSRFWCRRRFSIPVVSPPTSCHPRRGRRGQGQTCSLLYPPSSDPICMATSQQQAQGLRRC